MNYAAILAWALEFLKDDHGQNSSTRLISIGAATACAVYLLFGPMLTRMGICEWSPEVASDCVWAMAALGGVVYAANRFAPKRGQPESGE